MKKSHQLITYCFLLLVSNLAQAATIAFTTFSVQDGASNTLKSGGVATGITVARAGTGATSSDFVYSITYNNQSIDGDGINDTITFDVRVTSVSGTSSVNYAGAGVNALNTATIGSTAATTAVRTFTLGSNATVWTVDSGIAADSPDVEFNTGDTLVFSLENINVTSSVGLYSASLASFNTLGLAEQGGNSHRVLVGSGSNLQGAAFSGSTSNPSLTSYTDSTLYVSAAGSSNNNFSVRHIGFTLNTVAVPEPSSMALLALGLTSLAFARRRKS